MDWSTVAREAFGVHSLLQLAGIVVVTLLAGHQLIAHAIERAREDSPGWEVFVFASAGIWVASLICLPGVAIRAGVRDCDRVSLIGTDCCRSRNHDGRHVAKFDGGSVEIWTSDLDWQVIIPDDARAQAETGERR